jgi:hypothetical protein
MRKIIFVTRYPIMAEGHGGIHRTYQIYKDLEAAAGVENIITMTLEPGDRAPGQIQVPNEQNPFRRFSKRAQNLYVFMRLKANPYRYLHYHYSRNSQHDYFGSVPTYKYLELIEEQNDEYICFIDHPSQSELIEINKKRNIPTICCPQNIESLDAAHGNINGYQSLYTMLFDNFREYRLLAACDERLMISKIETSILNGMGVDSNYYPYRPVGEIKDYFLDIRRARAQTDQVKGLFLMVGSTMHAPTRKGFEWFIENAIRFGLPSGIRIVVGGKGSEQLASDHPPIPNIEIRGWLSQEEFRTLLTLADGFLIPQQSGFGAATRIPEMVCAGIPLLISSHLAYAQNVSPSAAVLGDHWEEWCDEMVKVSSGKTDIPVNEFLEWENSQPNPIAMTLKKYTGARNF